MLLLLLMMFFMIAVVVVVDTKSNVFSIKRINLRSQRHQSAIFTNGMYNTYTILIIVVIIIDVNQRKYVLLIHNV